jgi:hypothetical protein
VRLVRGVEHGEEPAGSVLQGNFESGLGVDPVVHTLVLTKFYIRFLSPSCVCVRFEFVTNSIEQSPP